jgi:UPF0755 protein
MNDIVPPRQGQQFKRPLGERPPQAPPARPLPPQRPLPPPLSSISQPLIDTPAPPLLLEAPLRRRSRKKIILWVMAALAALLLIAAASAYAWYTVQLTPISPRDTAKVGVQIASGSSPAQIGQLLEDKKVIRSRIAFDIYTRLSGVQAGLQAGTYNFSPSESMEQIVAHLVAGKTDELIITFLPGATLAEHRDRLIKANYSQQAVDTALNKAYDHPLFADKPAAADLEGYIYGETYHFGRDTTVEQILIRTFDEYYKALTTRDLIESFKNQGLNLYEGITLASIIQREVSRPGDQKQVAQVFYTRMGRDMPLGADATFVYGAKKMGVAPSVSLDSPYNTRLHPGLPPGPIASPGLSALQAVAAPAEGNYLFFVSGDDGVSHFSYTQDEHDAATRQYCQKNCNLF